MTLEIRDDVPIPPRGAGRGRPKGEFTQKLLDLRVGQVLIAPCEDRRERMNMSSKVSRVRARTGREFTSRLIESDDGLDARLHIWREK